MLSQRRVARMDHQRGTRHDGAQRSITQGGDAVDSRATHACQAKVHEQRFQGAMAMECLPNYLDQCWFSTGQSTASYHRSQDTCFLTFGRARRQNPRAVVSDKWLHFPPRVRVSTQESGHHESGPPMPELRFSIHSPGGYQYRTVLGSTSNPRQVIARALRPPKTTGQRRSQECVNATEARVRNSQTTGHHKSTYRYHLRKGVEQSAGGLVCWMR